MQASAPAFSASKGSSRRSNQMLHCVASANKPARQPEVQNAVVLWMMVGKMLICDCNNPQVHLWHLPNSKFLLKSADTWSARQAIAGRQYRHTVPPYWPRWSGHHRETSFLHFFEAAQNTTQHQLTLWQKNFKNLCRLAHCWHSVSRQCRCRRSQPP
jgi:hypothetical protein